jgi:hypothetical protein
MITGYQTTKGVIVNKVLGKILLEIGLNPLVSYIFISLNRVFIKG